MSKIYKVKQETLVDMYTDKKMTYREMMNKMDIKVISKSANFIEFDLIGVDASIANALRRTLINDIPTYAVDKVTIHDNTSVLPDEFLAHRLGLIPISMDPEIDHKNLSFELKIANNTADVLNVTSSHIAYLDSDAYADVQMQKDIPIAKLAPKQNIDVKMTIEKNTGKTHAKWSPVCPATYRLLPIITIEDIYDEEAVKLQKCFTGGVIDLVHEGGRLKAVVKDPRRESMSREVLRHPELQNKVFIGRKSDHFIFTIETLALDPIYLVKKALNILIQKLNDLKQNIQIAKSIDE